MTQYECDKGKVSLGRATSERKKTPESLGLISNNSELVRFQAEKLARLH